MLKIVLPVVLALAGLGAGLGAGLALRPAPAATGAACGEAAQGGAGEGAAAEVPAADCAEAAAVDDGPGGGGEFETISLDKPFVVPVFAGEKAVAMVVLSLSVEVAQGGAEHVRGLQPRLRDGLLAAMFRHANSGGFEGSYTEGQKMADLKAALLAAAREVMPGVGVGGVLVTEIIRQEV